MKKAYYSLIARFEKSDSFSVQFGDYERETVAQEIEDSFDDCYQVKIISTAPEQAAIMARVAELNSKL